MYAKSSADHLLKSVDVLIEKIKSGEAVDTDSFFDRLEAEEDELYSKSKKELMGIFEVDDDEIQKLYAETFNRWRPENF